MTTKCTIISTESGSSLITVGLFIMALGILSGAGLQIYQQFGQAQRMTVTQEKLETVKTAMLAYFSQQGRFPCPAPLSAPMDNAAYGREAASPCGDGGPGHGAGEPGAEEEVAGAGGVGGAGGGIEIEIGAGGVGVGIGELELGVGDPGVGEIIDLELGGGPPAGTPPVTGTTPGGMVIPGLTPPIETAPTIPTEELPKYWTGRDVGWELPADETYDPGLTSYSNGTIVVRGRLNKNVRIGNVPTRALNLPDSMGFDEWGNRLIYVLTEEMALTGADEIHNLGAITLEDPNGNSVSSAPGNVVLIIMSSGGDPRGAIATDGTMVQACDANALAGRNCDANATFTNSVNKVHDNGTDTFSHRIVYVGADFIAEE